MNDTQMNPVSYHLHHLSVSNPKVPAHWGHSSHLEHSNNEQQYQFLITSDHPTSIKSPHLASGSILNQLFVLLYILRWTCQFSLLCILRGAPFLSIKIS